MKINCISCGHSFSLDDAYDDFSGFVKCYVCGGMLEIKTVEGKLRFVTLAGIPHPGAGTQGTQPMAHREH